MGKYLESNLSRDEKILEDAKIHSIAIIVNIIGGIVFFWTFIVPIIALKNIISMLSMELGFTNKRAMGKYGLINTHRLDAPLNKIDNVSISQGLGGKILGYGTIVISSTSSKFGFKYIGSPEIFRSKLMAQIDQFDEDRIRKQAEIMAQGMKNN